MCYLFNCRAIVLFDMMTAKIPPFGSIVVNKCHLKELANLWRDRKWEVFFELNCETSRFLCQAVVVSTDLASFQSANFVKASSLIWTLENFDVTVVRACPGGSR